MRKGPFIFGQVDASLRHPPAWCSAGRKGDRAAGNGAAMRIAPLAFCTEPNTSEGRQLIRDVCRITHHNEEAYVGAVATVLAINLSMASPELPVLDEISSKLPDSVVRDRLLALVGSETTPSISEAARKYGTSGFVADSVPLALFASQQVSKIGFAEMLEQVIKVGGDTDTIASIACQNSRSSSRPLVSPHPSDRTFAGKKNDPGCGKSFCSLGLGFKSSGA
jgi:ADP-ribosyl-[dinitrogen reductase] hydrolase